MFTILKQLLWDPAAARAMVLTALTVGGAYVAQPAGRTWVEKLLTAAALGAPVGAASLPSTKNAAGEEH